MDFDGGFVETVLTVEKTFNDGLLVMATHGRRGIEKLVLGNLAEKMLSRIPVPLLAVLTNESKK